MIMMVMIMIMMMMMMIMPAVKGCMMALVAMSFDDVSNEYGCERVRAGVSKHDEAMAITPESW